jgi:hypothetical protein
MATFDRDAGRVYSLRGESIEQVVPSPIAESALLKILSMNEHILSTNQHILEMNTKLLDNFMYPKWIIKKESE